MDAWKGPCRSAGATGVEAAKTKILGWRGRLAGLSQVLALAGLLATGLAGLPRSSAQLSPDIPPAAAANNITSMEALDERQKLGPGDRVSYRVIEDKEDAKSLVISDTGDLDVPYLGRVKAADKTCKVVAHEIQRALTNDLYYKATVILAVDMLNKKRGSVYLAGNIRNAGLQDIPSDEVLTLTKAILRAGGFTDFADKKKVKITRQLGKGNANKVFVIDVAEILEKGKTEKDQKLEPDDMIFVPRRMINY